MPSDLRSKFTALPVAGYLADDDLAQLEADGFDLDTFRSIPVAGVFTSEQILRLSPVLASVAAAVHAETHLGPVTPDEVMSLVR